VTCGLPRDQRPGWNHREVLLSLIYHLLSYLLGLLVVLLRSDMSKEAEPWLGPPVILVRSSGD
jgi:hypothetical protein